MKLCPFCLLKRIEVKRTIVRPKKKLKRFSEQSYFGGLPHRRIMTCARGVFVHVSLEMTFHFSCNMQKSLLC